MRKIHKMFYPGSCFRNDQLTPQMHMLLTGHHCTPPWKMILASQRRSPRTDWGWDSKSQPLGSTSTTIKSALVPEVLLRLVDAIMQGSVGTHSCSKPTFQSSLWPFHPTGLFTQLLYSISSMYPGNPMKAYPFHIVSLF